MKKIKNIGITMLLTLSLVGCSKDEVKTNNSQTNKCDCYVDKFRIDYYLYTYPNGNAEVRYTKHNWTIEPTKAPCDSINIGIVDHTIKYATHPLVLPYSDTYYFYTTNPIVTTEGSPVP